MLKEIAFRETMKHICNGKRPLETDLKIFLHDTQAYATLPDGTEFFPIKFCPYCGKEIESELNAD